MEIESFSNLTLNSDENYPRLEESEIKSQWVKDFEMKLILTKVIQTLNFKDQLNFSLVCHEWYRAASPFIHQSMKLFRREFIEQNWLSKDDKLIQSEIEIFFDCNFNHLPFIQQLQLNFKKLVIINPSLLSNLSHITKLTIDDCSTSYNVILSCLRPLSNLQCLILNYISFDDKESGEQLTQVHLPSTLTTLQIKSINYSEPNQILPTLCSHTNLEEFTFSIYGQSNLSDLTLNGGEWGIFIPFLKYYPTLKKLKFSHSTGNFLRDFACRVLQFNPHLTEINLMSFDHCYTSTKDINFDLANSQRLSHQRSQEAIPFRLDPIELAQSRLSHLTIRLNWKSANQIISLINLLSPQLIKLRLVMDPQWNQFEPILTLEYPILIQLDLDFRNICDGDNFTCDFNPKFIEEWDKYLIHFNQLKMINVYNFHLSYFQMNSFNRLPLLEVIRSRFCYRSSATKTPFWYKWEDYSNIQESDLNHMIIRGWKIKYEVQGQVESCAIYIPNTQLSIDYLSMNYFN